MSLALSEITIVDRSCTQGYQVQVHNILTEMKLVMKGSEVRKCKKSEERNSEALGSVLLVDKWNFWVFKTIKMEDIR